MDLYKSSETRINGEMDNNFHRKLPFLFLSLLEKCCIVNEISNSSDTANVVTPFSENEI